MLVRQHLVADGLEAVQPCITAVAHGCALRTGDVYQDKAASHCRGEQLTAHIGVWPEMSMLNHRQDCTVARAALSKDLLTLW